MKSSSYIIGKSNVMYTLYEYNGSGYTFVKNISKDINKVKKLYPDLKVDVSIHGYYPTTPMYYEERVEKNPECFPGGKYNGAKIAECNDRDYLNFIYNNKIFEDFKERIFARAIELGSISFGGLLYNSKEFEEMMVWKKFIDNGGTYEIYMDTNADADGCFYYRGHCLIFADYKVLNYQGFYYSLPVLNGKAKRVKGKSIVITKFHVEGGNIVIEDFDIKK